ncbi:hypothetical protein B14911_23222 [Bacillus sp. NRRL B-14911]|nr:hypothetical protein B14911_23222 [Bacillus sp. NRRL B-14911]
MIKTSKFIIRVLAAGNQGKEKQNASI